MSLVVALSLFLALVVQAKVVPRAGPIQTVTVPVPYGSFTTTVPGCGGTVDPFAIIGTSAGNFKEGTVVRYLPPQASPTSTTYTQTASNGEILSEVVICKVLPGDCAPFPTLAPAPSPDSSVSATTTGSPSSTSPTSTVPSSTAGACPEKGCSGAIVKGAKLVIDVINNVSLLSQNLQFKAVLVGTPPSGAESGSDTGVVDFAQSPIEDVARGLLSIVTVLTTAIPRIAFLPPFVAGCSSDTIVVALVEFVLIHQALLNILIGQAGLLENGPIRRGIETEGAVEVYERAASGFIGKPIAVALRALEKIVDTVAAKIIGLVPTRGECAKQEKAKLDALLKESIVAYDQ